MACQQILGIPSQKMLGALARIMLYPYLDSETTNRR